MTRAQVPRTATFSWSPYKVAEPLLATATVVGALDESFSNESQLEIWSPLAGQAGSDNASTLQPKGVVAHASRFNRIAWGYDNHADRPKGVLAAGMETGELGIWDPVKILASESADKFVACSCVSKTSAHSCI